jgi:hypothetical protein
MRFFKPGQLSLDWLEGKRARYVPPFRMYIIASFFLFLLVGMATMDVAEEAVAKLKVDTETVESLNKELETARSNNDWASAILLEASIQTLEDPVGYMRKIVSNLPKAAFLLLPLFALIHLIINVRHDRYYIDYLVFSLNLHAFSFILISTGVLISMLIPPLKGPTDLLNFVIPLYLVIAFKRFHRQKWLKSIAKAVIAFGLYSFILMFLVVFYFGLALFI